MTKAEELKARTERFALEVVELCRQLPQTLEATKMKGQLLDAATSVAANYRAACRARSRAEFVSKISTVVEEIDESGFWIGLLVKTKLVAKSSVAWHAGEAEELLAIFIASQKTAQSRLRR